MRDALITLAGALLSIFLLVSLMSPQTQEEYISRPNTEDAGKHGLKALRTWLDSNNVNTLSLRKPLTRMDSDLAPKTGNMMVLSLPLNRDALDTEWEALNEWISQGNAVLVLASLYHVPQWGDMFEWVREDEIVDALASITADAFSLQRDDFEETESEFSLTDMQASIQAFRPAAHRLFPVVGHSLFDQVDELATRHTPGMYQYENDSDELQASYWAIVSDSARLAMRLLHAEDPEHTAMWLLPVGGGWLYLSAFPDLVSNSMLKQQDNARWFANLMSHAVADGGYVIFDDYHFGLSDLYDPQAFFADHRLHDSLLFVGAFWLVYALGRSPRLAPVRRPIARPASMDYIEAMAGFFTRRVKARTIARELASSLLQDISQQTQLSGNALWRWLHDHPRVAEHDIQRLQRARDNKPGRAGLIQLTRSIHRIQKVLT